MAVVVNAWFDDDDDDNYEDHYYGEDNELEEYEMVIIIIMKHKQVYLFIPILDTFSEVKVQKNSCAFSLMKNNY